MLTGNSGKEGHMDGSLTSEPHPSRVPGILFTPSNVCGMTEQVNKREKKTTSSNKGRINPVKLEVRKLQAD